MQEPQSRADHLHEIRLRLAAEKRKRKALRDEEHAKAEKGGVPDIPQFRGVESQTKLHHFPDFCRKQLHILDIEGKLVPMSLNWIQWRLFRWEWRQRQERRPVWYIVLKYRKGGVTTYFQAMNFWEMWARKYTEAITYAQTREDTDTIFRMVTRFYDNQPRNRRHLKTDAATRHIEFPDWGGIYRSITAGATSSLRGATVARIHLSEAAHYGDLRTLYGGISKSTRTNAAFGMESTPNGKTGNGQAFYEFWDAAMKGQSVFTPLFFAWHDEPANRLPLIEPDEISTSMSPEEGSMKVRFSLDDNQIKWWREERRRIVADGRSHRIILQEHPNDPESCFIEGGEGYYDPKALDRAEARCEPPLAPGDLKLEYGLLWVWIERGILRIWEEPKQDSSYIIGVDTAEGVGRDDSAAVGFNSVSGQQAFSWNWNKVPADEFGYRVLGKKPDPVSDPAGGIAYMWRQSGGSLPAFCIIERDGPGDETISNMMNVADFPAEALYHDMDHLVEGADEGRRAGWRHRHDQLTVKVGRMLRENWPIILDIEIMNSIRAVSDKGDGTAEFGGRDLAVAAGVATIGMEFAKPPSQFVMVGGRMIDVVSGKVVDTSSFPTDPHLTG